MDKKILDKAAKELGVEKESLTKNNRPLLDNWLAEQKAEPEPVRKRK